MSHDAAEQAGHGTGEATEVDPAEPSLRRKLIWRSLLLLITGISLYALAPSLLEVFSAWRQLATIEPEWLAAMVVFEIASFVCVWELQRIALRTKNMFAVASSQLAGNAVGRIIPGGAATAGAMQFRMLARAGVPTNTAASALLAVTLLLFATVIAMPVLAIPTLLGGTSVDASLAIAAVVGVALFVLLLAAGIAMFVWDAPLELIGSGVQWVLNRVRRGAQATTGLGARLLRERDFIRETLGSRWWEALGAAAARWTLDYLALLAALFALGVEADMWVILLAYVAAQLLGMIPITPGGLGFVEAGLTGMLVLAGVSAGDAAVATLLYRLVSFWLPLPAGGVAYALFRYRYKDGELDGEAG